MSKLQEKIRENKNRLKRLDLIEKADSHLSEAINRLDFTNDVHAIKLAAFPTWDPVSSDYISTRGQIPGWTRFEFQYWINAVEFIGSIRPNSNIPGLMFFDTDGPYYYVDLHSFLGLVDSISDFCCTYDKDDFGWVGIEIDAGILVEFEHTSMCKNEFSVCCWGLDA